MASSSFAVSLSAGINFCPQTVAEEVVQNVRTILLTAIGTVPFDRAFGTDWGMLDQPLPVAMQLSRAAFYEAVQRLEPRAVVESLEWDPDAAGAEDGILRPRLTISLADGVDGTAAVVQED